MVTPLTRFVVQVVMLKREPKYAPLMKGKPTCVVPRQRSQADWRDLQRNRHGEARRVHVLQIALSDCGSERRYSCTGNAREDTARNRVGSVSADVRCRVAVFGD